MALVSHSPQTPTLRAAADTQSVLSSEGWCCRDLFAPWCSHLPAHFNLLPRARGDRFDTAKPQLFLQKQAMAGSSTQCRNWIWSRGQGDTSRMGFTSASVLQYHRPEHSFTKHSAEERGITSVLELILKVLIEDIRETSTERTAEAQQQGWARQGTSAGAVSREAHGLHPAWRLPGLQCPTPSQRCGKQSRACHLTPCWCWWLNGKASLHLLGF